MSGYNEISDAEWAERERQEEAGYAEKCRADYIAELTYEHTDWAEMAHQEYLDEEAAKAKAERDAIEAECGPFHGPVADWSCIGKPRSEWDTTCPEHRWYRDPSDNLPF